MPRVAERRSGPTSAASSSAPPSASSSAAAAAAAGTSTPGSGASQRDLAQSSPRRRGRRENQPEYADTTLTVTRDSEDSSRGHAFGSAGLWPARGGGERSRKRTPRKCG